uniref:Uncharacterized protein n=1 Tax=Hyaloperonospora arabidopsidis (strain Emoy2) TaxID=559515 RepID=M4B1N0_HYAAE
MRYACTTRIPLRSLVSSEPLLLTRGSSKWLDLSARKRHDSSWSSSNSCTRIKILTCLGSCKSFLSLTTT